MYPWELRCKRFISLEMQHIYTETAFFFFFPKF